MHNEQAKIELKKQLILRGFGEKHAEKKSFNISRSWLPSVLTKPFTAEYVAGLADRALRDEIAEYGSIRDDSKITPIVVPIV